MAMERPLQKSAWRAALGSIGISGLLAGVGLATGTLSARLLGPEGRGELAAIQTVPVLLAALALAGMPSALTFFTAKDTSQARRLLVASVIIGFPVALLLAGAGYVALPALLAQQRPAVIEAAQAYLLLVPIHLIVALSYGALLGVSSFGAWNLLRSLPPLAWLAVLLVGAAAGIRSAGQLSSMYLVAFALIVPFAGYLVMRFTPRSKMVPSADQAAALVKFGLPGALATVPMLLNLRLDQVVMSAMIPATQLGLYAAAVSWSGALTPLISATSPIILPLMARAEMNHAQRIDTATRATRLSVLLATGGSGLVFILTPFAMRLLFGASFASAIPAALVLAVAAGFGGLNGLLGEVLKGLGAPRWPLVGEMVSLPMTLVLLLVLLPRLGLMGAAIASLVAYSMATVVLVGGLRNITMASMPSMCLPRMADVAGLWLLFKSRTRA
jgi:O-antigen/teichoic acid export membrane protein